VTAVAIHANTFWDWMRRWGLWILLALAIVAYMIARLLPWRNKRDLFIRAREEAGRLRDETALKLDKIRAEMEDRRHELAEIKSIGDEAIRLKALADFANRGRR
jgi:hypothetical protein